MNLDIKLFPPLLQDTIEAIKELTNAPDELVLQCVLATANLCVHAHYDVDCSAWGFGKRPISCWFISMLPTGASKSTIFKKTTEGVNRWMKEQKDTVYKDKARFELETQMHKKKMAAFKRRYEEYIEANAIQSEIDLLIQNETPLEPVPVATADYLMSKATLNAMILKLVSQPMLGIHSDEGGEFVNSHAFQGGPKDQTLAKEMIAGLTKMWDGGELSRQTVDSSISIDGRRFNIALLAQETMVRLFLTSSVNNDQGLVHRFLITQAGYFIKPEYTTDPVVLRRRADCEKVVTRFNDYCYNLINKPFRLVNSKHDAYALDPEVITIDRAAEEHIGYWYNTVNDVKTLGVKEEYFGFAQRYLEHRLRLAATLAAFDNRTSINMSDSSASLALINFYIEQRNNIEFEAGAKDPEQKRIVENLIAWMREHSWSGTKREFSQYAPYGVQKMDDDQVLRILSDMVSTGEVDIKAVGKRKEFYIV